MWSIKGMDRQTQEMRDPHYAETHRRLKSAELISRAAVLSARVADTPWKSLGTMITDQSGTAALRYWNDSMARTQHAGGLRAEPLVARFRSETRQRAAKAPGNKSEVEL